MEEMTLENWQQFEEAINDIEHQRHQMQRGTTLKISDLLFRGQGNSAWRLETTLDRFFKRDVSLQYYYRIILAAKAEIETFTGAKWDIPSLEEYETWIHEELDVFFGEFKPYEYLAYLRHHGFPSPLLDWTSSPYIAAFFAFNNINENADYVSVFVFCEYSSGGKSATSAEPVIRSLGPYVRAHKRHFLQQSQYTVCTVYRQDGIFYAKHEDIVSRDDKHQDLICKLNVPASERKNALTKLNRMNINAFSLFGTEDSLLETIATSDVFLKGRNL